jgi:hypothetical protein
VMLEPAVVSAAQGFSGPVYLRLADGSALSKEAHGQPLGADNDEVAGLDCR